MVKKKVGITLSFRTYSKLFAADSSAAAGLLEELNHTRCGYLSFARLYADYVDVEHLRKRFWSNYYHYLIITDLLKELGYEVTLDFNCNQDLKKCEQVVKLLTRSL